MRAIALPSGWRLFAAQAGLLMTAVALACHPRGGMWRIPVGGWYPLAFTLMFTPIALQLTAKRALYQRRNATALS
ncbi:hypothetical protein [Pseudomonas putida]|uniref:hypothetical protein n=1 Tax=Pseudomonas putida TaxID=303 RepID=UPI003AEFCD3B